MRTVPDTCEGAQTVPAKVYPQKPRGREDSASQVRYACRGRGDGERGVGWGGERGRGGREMIASTYSTILPSLPLSLSAASLSLSPPLIFSLSSSFSLTLLSSHLLSLTLIFSLSFLLSSPTPLLPPPPSSSTP